MGKFDTALTSRPYCRKRRQILKCSKQHVVTCRGDSYSPRWRMENSQTCTICNGRRRRRRVLTFRCFFSTVQKLYVHSHRGFVAFHVVCALCFIDQFKFRFFLLIPLFPAMTRASTHVFVFSNRGFQCLLNFGGVRVCNCNRVQFCGYLRFFMSTVIIIRRFTA